MQCIVDIYNLLHVSVHCDACISRSCTLHKHVIALLVTRNILYLIQIASLYLASMGFVTVLTVIFRLMTGPTNPRITFICFFYGILKYSKNILKYSRISPDQAPNRSTSQNGRTHHTFLFSLLSGVPGNGVHVCQNVVCCALQGQWSYY